MNDLPWIKYEAKVMYCDCADMSRECELAHRRLFDLLCILGRPIGGGDGAVREIGRVKECDWMRVRAELNTKGWRLTADGAWTHDGTATTIAESLRSHVVRRKQTEDARLAKLNQSRTCVISGETSSVTQSVTDSVTDSVTEPVTERDLDFDLESDLDLEKEVDKAY